jgi:anti-sigma factor RsiW
VNNLRDITCREVIDFLMAYIDGELPPNRAREFDRHLELCPSCVAYLETYKATVRLGRVALADESSTESVPQGLLRAIRAARAERVAARAAKG